MNWAGVSKVAALIAPLMFPPVAFAITFGVTSDDSWTVTDPTGTYLGNAQDVCLNQGSPPSCPAGATLFGYPHPGWLADLATNIPSATWMWAPDVTGRTTPAANAAFTFQKEFYLCGSPSGGTIWLAADNAAEVLLNGKSCRSSHLCRVRHLFLTPSSQNHALATTRTCLEASLR